MINKSRIIILTVFVLVFLAQYSYAQESNQISINSIKMNDFYKIALSESELGTVKIFETTDYQILFYPKFKNEFNINIKEDKFNQLRTEGENKLLSILGITKLEACWLNITVETTYSASTNTGGKKIRPSFCLGAGRANLNGDSSVNTLDYAIGLKQYGKEAPILSGDLNYDHKVNATDISELIKYLGQSVN